MKALALILALALALLQGIAVQAAPSYQASSVKELGCSQMVETFCDSLWSPKYMGNMDLKIAAETRPVRLGRTPNDIGYPLYDYESAIVEARPRLPKAFVKRLDSRYFFQKLKNYLSRKPNAKLSRGEEEKARTLWSEVISIWSDAEEETVYDRIAPRAPNFYRLTNDNVPFSDWLEYFKAKDMLDSELLREIWTENPKWKIIENEFKEVQSEFVNAIEGHPDLSPAIKKDWSARLRSVTLVVPGSDPKIIDDFQRRCAKTMENAFYSGTENTITVCGGFISQGNVLRVLAHELAHSLGVTRTVFIYKNSLELAQELKNLQQRTCRQDFMSCSDWSKWKENYPKRLTELKPLDLPKKQFLACFRKRGEPKDQVDESVLNYIAKNRVDDGIEYTARASGFLNLIKKTEILKDGSEHPNPRYLNPCGFSWSNPESFFLTSSIQFSTFFVNEYHCRMEAEKPKNVSDEKILEEAIDAAKAMELPLAQREILVPGHFSSDRELEREKFAEDVEEDVADNLGEDILARIMMKRYPRLDDRRSFFFATAANLCDRPSIEKLYPAEAQVQKKYYLDPHSEGEERRQRLMTLPIREALGCKKDFPAQIKECRL